MPNHYKLGEVKYRREEKDLWSPGKTSTNEVKAIVSYEMNRGILLSASSSNGLMNQAVIDLSGVDAVRLGKLLIKAGENVVKIRNAAALADEAAEEIKTHYTEQIQELIK